MPHRIRMVLSDVDGVLTDGSITIDDAGRESKTFNVLDGSAVANLQRAGLRVGLISGRSTRATLFWARTFDLAEVHQGVHDKLRVMRELAARAQLGLDEVCYIGDDLLDLEALAAVGFSAAPADARPEVRARVDFVADAPGGRGVLRSVAEYILKAQGLWSGVLARYLPADEARASFPDRPAPASRATTTDDHAATDVGCPPDEYR
jgi:3-deoxy-D-manno-octulosonate 8-phosphate phosphatase (KDO 8-P phosphatase)